MGAARLLALLSVLLLGSCLQYSVKVQGSSIYCFSSYIAKNSPLHFRVSSTSSNKYSLTMSLPNGTVVTRKEQVAKLKKIDTYSRASFEYTFCLENMEPVPDEFHINFHEGVEVAGQDIQMGDLSHLPKMEDLRYVEELVEIISDTHTKLRELQDVSKNTNEYSMEVQKLISFKTLAFGFLSLAVILIVGFLHYTEIRRTLKNRKMI